MVIPILNNQTVEAATETLAANIANVVTQSGYANRITIQVATKAINIIEDDSSQLSIADASVTEDTGTVGQVLMFEITLTKPLDVNATVNYTLSSNGDPGFVFGTDVTQAAGTYTDVIPAEQTSWLVGVNAIADGVAEGDETFRLIVTGITPAGGAVRNVTLGDNIAVGTIDDND